MTNCPYRPRHAPKRRRHIRFSCVRVTCRLLQQGLQAHESGPIYLVHPTGPARGTCSPRSGPPPPHMTCGRPPPHGHRSELMSGRQSGLKYMKFSPVRVLVHLKYGALLRKGACMFSSANVCRGGPMSGSPPDRLSPGLTGPIASQVQLHLGSPAKATATHWHMVGRGTEGSSCSQ